MFKSFYSDLGPDETCFEKTVSLKTLLVRLNEKRQQCAKACLIYNLNKLVIKISHTHNYTGIALSRVLTGAYLLFSVCVCAPVFTDSFGPARAFLSLFHVHTPTVAPCQCMKTAEIVDFLSGVGVRVCVRVFVEESQQRLNGATHPPVIIS